MDMHRSSTGPGKRAFRTPRGTGIFATRGRQLGPILVLAGATLPACGAEPGSASDSSPRPAALPDWHDVGTVQSASTASDVCSLVNNVGNAIRQAPINGVLGSATPIINCSADSVTNLYYHGAETLTNTLEDLFIMPYVTDGAYLCGIADADGATVDGTLNALGGFGVRSQFNVITRNPAQGHVAGRRVGSVVLFGVPAKLLVQDIDLTAPVELGTNSTPNFWGGYLKLASTGINWNFDMSVTIPIGAIQVTIHPQFHSLGPTRNASNDGISFAPNNGNNQLAAAYQYNNWLACVQNPTTCPQPRSDVDNGTLMLEHLVSCPGDITNLSDGFLPFYSPWGGAGCASQSFIFIDVLNNWFHFGRPSGVSLLPGEPNNVITSTTDTNTLQNSATFWAGLDVQTAFNIDILSVSLDVNTTLASRDGFAVRQAHTLPSELGQFGEPVNVTTDLNAQSMAKVDIDTTIALTGLLGPTHVHFSLGPWDTGNRESSTAPNAAITNLGYTNVSSTNQYTSLNEYQVKGVNKTNPDSARLACMTTAPTTATAVAPDDPAGYLKNVATAAINSVHPCNVQTCTDASHETDYAWNSSTHALVRSTTHNPCTICFETKMNMCDAGGNLLNDPTTGRPILIEEGTLSPLPLGCVR